jgi:BMFP domain-containing protein YqiC
MEDLNVPATKGDIDRISSVIDQLRSAMSSDVDQLRSDMKGDLNQLRSEMKGDLDQLRSEMNHQYRDLVERFDDNTTRLMNAFYAAAETNSRRITLVEGNEAAVRSRLGTLEDRMMAVEKRLNMPAEPQRQ